MNLVDLDIWVTQKALADELGITIQAVQNWVQRKQIQTMTIPGNTVLVNKETIDIKSGMGRPRKIKNDTATIIGGCQECFPG